MARVLILTLVFPPDNVSTAQLLGELAVDIQREGHKVCVITTLPHYNPPAGKTTGVYRTWLSPLLYRSRLEEAPVYHVWMPKKGKNLVLRACAWGLFHLFSTILAYVIPFRPDVILTPSPPLTIGMSAWLIAFVRRSRFIYNIQEIYPDVAIHLGMIRSRLMIQALYGIESFVYARAAALTTISEGMRRCIISKGVAPSDVHLIPNFVDIGDFGNMQKDNHFCRMYGLHKKFVISYAGNMGRPQALDVFIRAMALVQARRPEAHLLMVGSGTEYEPLRSLAAKLRLENVTFIPHLPYSEVPAVYATSDLSIVSQSAGTHSDGIPSKVYRIMGSSRAVFALTDEGSDLCSLVRGARAGMVVSKGDVVVIANAIVEAASDPAHWTECGMRGRGYVTAHFSRARVSRLYADLIAQVASRGAC